MAQVSALPVGPLRPDGRFFRDRQNRAVILHGLFGVWKIPGLWGPPDSPTDPRGFTAADADRVAALGLNGFRLAYFWEGLEPTRGAYDTAYLANIVRVQKLLAGRGVFTLIDSHQDMYSSVFGGDGFPAWAVHDDGVPLGVDLGFPGNYFTPAVSRAFDNFWRNADGVLDAYARQLAFVARHFADDPMVLGYDLINEPWPGTEYPSCLQPLGCPLFDTLRLQPAEDRLAWAVRKADWRHIIFYEPNFFFTGGVRSWLGAPPARVRRVALSFHNQCVARAVLQLSRSIPGAGPLLGAPVAVMNSVVCPTANAQVLANAMSTAAAIGGPPLMTEVAAPSDSDHAGLNCLFELADQKMVGWTYGLSWRSGELRTLHPEKAAVLARAYPQAVAGTPSAFSFDVRTGRFTLRYTTRPHTAGPTVIELPAATYPNGYTVAAQGAHVTSAPGAELLTLANDPGAHSVHVTVDPRSGPAPVLRPQFPACPSGALPT